MRIKLNIPLENYTDNVREILLRPLIDHNIDYGDISSFLCSPQITDDELETALDILKKTNSQPGKRHKIEAELRIRKNQILPKNHAYVFNDVIKAVYGTGGRK